MYLHVVPYLAVKVGNMEVDMEVGAGRLVETGLLYLQYHCHVQSTITQLLCRVHLC